MVSIAWAITFYACVRYEMAARADNLSRGAILSILQIVSFIALCIASVKEVGQFH